MAITEDKRHQLYNKLEEVLGMPDATTLMEHLPPVGWADVATKRDLDSQLNQFRAEMYKALNEQTHKLISWMLAANAMFAGAVLAAVKLVV